MKSSYLFLLFGVILLAAPITPLSAQPQAPSGYQDEKTSGTTFERMSLADLKAVDRKALTKTERKAHKRALRAEKKRLKIMAKKAAARQKAIDKRRKKVNKVYKRTEIVRDRFTKTIKVLGPTKNKSKFMSGSWEKRYMRAFFEPGTLPIIQVYTTQEYNPEIDYYFNPPRDEHGNTPWRSYYAANLAGGISLPFIPFGGCYIDCEDGSCKKSEDFAITFDWFYLSELIGKGASLEYKVFARNKGSYVTEISGEYLLGFFKALLEVMGDHNKDARDTVAMIDAALDTLPPEQDDAQ